MRNSPGGRAAVLLAMGIVLPAAVIRAQDLQPMQPIPGPAPATAPATGTAPTTATGDAVATTLPAGATPILARVIEVKGDCQFAPPGSEAFSPCKLGDTYSPETVISTGLRSRVVLRMGEDDTYTVVAVDPGTKTLIGEAFTTADTKRVQIGVGYGQVRAGVVEGGLKSDFTVSSPVATLSKRGTWNFGMNVRPFQYEVFLLDQGLVTALDRASGRQRDVRPGEFVDSSMRRWVQLANRLQNVPISDILGQSDIEVAFNRLDQDGLKILNPEGGATTLIDLRPPQFAADFRQLAQNALRGSDLPPPVIDIGQRVRREAIFGTGRGELLAPIVIDRASELAQRGAAKPGTYRFSRSALQGWLSQQGR